MPPIRLLFVEFGTPDFDRFCQAVTSLPLGAVDVFRQLGPEVGNDMPVGGGVAEAMQVLRRLETMCVAMTPKVGEIKWVQILAPNAFDTKVSMWHGTLELRSASHEEILHVLKRAGLQYIAVAKDDPFDLTDENLRPDKFPWNSPNFVAAALTLDGGGYLEHPPENG